MDHIADLTSEDLRPECRALFVGSPPNEYSDTREVFIIKGEPTLPRKVEVVTRFALP
jgi:hypothetical protein